jgi:hypothetical protein
MPFSLNREPNRHAMKGGRRKKMQVALSGPCPWL